MTLRPLAIALALITFSQVAAAQYPGTVVTCHVRPTVGLHAGVPQRVSLGVGIVIPRACDSNTYAGYELFAEGGLGGGKAGFGLINFGLGAAAAQDRLVAMRTWGRPWKVDPWITYVGTEVRVTRSMLTIGTGFFWRTAGHGVGDAHLFTLSAGLGY